MRGAASVPAMGTRAHRSAGLTRILPVLIFAVWIATPAGATDNRRLEALGAAPMETHRASRSSPRDVALRRALQGAVWRVAVEQLDTAGATTKDATLAAALGKDPLVYATRFRVIEDRGERPALFSDDPKVENEYVVLAEVYVDVDRVRERLVSTGLMRLPSGEAADVRTRVTLVDVRSWAEIQAVRTLLGEIGARSAIPVDLERGRAVLAVESSLSPAALVRALIAAAPPELRLEPLKGGPDGLELRARFLETSGPNQPARASPFDTSEPEGY